MLVLVVEDEAPKCAHIQRFLAAILPEANVKIAKSVNSALDALDEELPDILLLDMSLPTFDVGDREPGGRPQGFGGIEILRHMAMADITCPTIVISGYEAFPREAGKPVDLTTIRQEMEHEFPGIVAAVLHYNSTYDEWKNLLRETISSMNGADQ